MFLKKKKKPKVFEIPQKEIKVKVLGKVDLEAINQNTKPSKESQDKKLARAKLEQRKAASTLNNDYNGIVNLLEFYQLCELRDSLNKYITLSQRVEKYEKNNS
jgi:hypothetical protein